MCNVTKILNTLERGEIHVAEQLWPFVYDELRQIAAQKMARESAGQALDATGLIHEAYFEVGRAGDGEDMAEPSTLLPSRS